MNDAPRKLRVVVAHSEAAIRDTATAVARRAGYEVVGVTDGESARALLQSQPSPVALVVDVALPDVLGYELCDEVAAAGLETKVILVASVYSRTAYKRRPTNLYGASDYVEQHHIVDQLGDKLGRAIAVASPQPVRRRQMSETGEYKAHAIREAGEGRLAFRYDNHADAIERAKGLARLLVADMALYCGEVIGAWRADGGRGDYPATLAADIDEARRLYLMRVPREIADEHDYFTAAVDEFLRGTRRVVDDGAWPLDGVLGGGE